MADAQPQSVRFLGVTIGDRYRIVSQLGAGGMGVAYRAWDHVQGLPVVIKMPKQAFLEEPRFAERFAREIRLMQGLRHPHVVPIVDFGQHQGIPYVVMRFLPGGSLSNRRLRNDAGKVEQNPPGMLHLWLPAVAEALDFIHAHGVVHRDVKPANIFFDAGWHAYLGDFGIAKVVEESDVFDGENMLTATNVGVGTREYMGPEHFVPKPILDGRADQYALAVMVYEVLAGVRPFVGSTKHLIVEVTTLPVPPLEGHRRGLRQSLIDAVHRGLSKRPEQRFATCREFAAAVLQDVRPIADEAGVARLLCPACSNMLKLPSTAAGQVGSCPRCRTQMKVAKDLGALWLLKESTDEPGGQGSPQPADPPAPVPPRVPPPVPPRVPPPVPPAESFPTGAPPGRDVVLRPPTVRRPGLSVAEIALGSISIAVIGGGILFGAIVFRSWRPLAAAGQTRPNAAGRAETRERPPPAWVVEDDGAEDRSTAKAPPVVEPGQKEEALEHLKEAVVKMRRGLFDVAKDSAGKAFRAGPTLKNEARAMWHVGEYASRYQPLAEQALQSLDRGSTVNLGPGKETCACVDRDGDSITLRVEGKDERFTIPRLSALPGVRFRITSRFLEKSREPESDLILGAVQYLNGLDPDGVPLQQGVNPIPDRWVKATKAAQATTRRHAEAMLALSRLELHE